MVKSSKDGNGYPAIYFTRYVAIQDKMIVQYLVISIYNCRSQHAGGSLW